MKIEAVIHLTRSDVIAAYKAMRRKDRINKLRERDSKTTPKYTAEIEKSDVEVFARNLTEQLTFGKVMKCIFLNKGITLTGTSNLSSEYVTKLIMES